MGILPACHAGVTGSSPVWTASVPATLSKEVQTGRAILTTPGKPLDEAQLSLVLFRGCGVMACISPCHGEGWSSNLPFSATDVSRFP